ncbi:MAG: OB-fold nucleic acid binding domain-containing protein [Nanoarchaeota archaeon]|nr:OB-fold nucleic acid binding domain-containing protein [Nanoarchaeota archaeon]
MENKLLLKLSFIFSIVGILILLIISNFNEPKPTKISDIKKDLVYKTIKINGEITSIKKQENRYVFQIKDSAGKIPIYFYSNKNLSINKGDNISITGKLSEYKDNFQLNANKIRVLD